MGNNSLIVGSVWLAANILVVNLNFVPLIYQLWSGFCGTVGSLHRQLVQVPCSLPACAKLHMDRT